MLGHYFPSTPLSVDELRSWGLPDIDRYVDVDINIIKEKFGNDSKEVI